MSDDVLGQSQVSTFAPVVPRPPVREEVRLVEHQTPLHPSEQLQVLPLPVGTAPDLPVDLRRPVPADQPVVVTVVLSRQLEHQLTDLVV